MGQEICVGWSADTATGSCEQSACQTHGSLAWRRTIGWSKERGPRVVKAGSFSVLLVGEGNATFAREFSKLLDNHEDTNCRVVATCFESADQ